MTLPGVLGTVPARRGSGGHGSHLFGYCHGVSDIGKRRVLGLDLDSPKYMCLFPLETYFSWFGTQAQGAFGGLDEASGGVVGFFCVQS